jgi:hypothetical protein
MISSEHAERWCEHCTCFYPESQIDEPIIIIWELFCDGRFRHTWFRSTDCEKCLLAREGALNTSPSGRNVELVGVRRSERLGRRVYPSDMDNDPRRP